jgi:hypothetical protein
VQRPRHSFTQVLWTGEGRCEVALLPALDLTDELGLLRLWLGTIPDEHQDRSVVAHLEVLLMSRRQPPCLYGAVAVVEDQHHCISVTDTDHARLLG